MNELDRIAAELYALPPAQFTAARNDLAKAAPRELTPNIVALRKPSVAAWALNLLVRDGQLADAVELSHALHDAQDDLDASELAKLGKQRRALAAGLARRAGALAAEAGQPLSSSALDEVERSVNAAIIDPSVAAAVLTGRLIRSVNADDGETLDEAVAGSPAGHPGAAAPSRDELAQRRARRAAEAAARDAEQAAAEAERELAQIEGRLVKARERAEQTRQRVQDLTEERERADADAERAEAERNRLDGSHAEASARARRTREESDRARAALENRATD